MRVLTAMGYVREVGLNMFAATPISHALVIPGNQAGIVHMCGHSGDSPIY